MSDVPPPPDLPQLDLSYETPPEHGNGPMLVRLGGIFLLIAGGLDLFYAAYEGLMLAIQYFVAARLPPPPPPPGFPAFMTVMTTVLPITLAVLSLLVAGIKTIGGVSLLRTSRRAWVLGLTAGIASCLTVWSCPCCFASLAAGIYTIVILCLPQVKVFLQARAAR